MAKRLVARGHEIRVLTQDSRRPARGDVAEYDGITVRYVPWLGRGSHQIPARFAEAAAEIRAADLVHCFGLYNLICPLAAWTSRQHGIPFVIEPMGMFIPRERSLQSKRLYNATLTRWMAARAAAIVATSQLEALELGKLASRSRLVVRGNGIDVEDFEDLSGAEQVRARWNIEPSQTVIAYVGRISSKKNLHGLIDAFAGADLPNTKLVLIGPVSEPGYEAELIRQIDASPRRRDIRIEGALYGEDLKAAWSAVDIFVLPSFNENFGNAAGEAVAANVPVLVSDGCGIAAMIHERAGLAVPPDANSLAAGLRRLTDPMECERLTAAAAEVKRELSWDGPIKQTEQLYLEIAPSVRS
jgi:glycosyltransferase involved in cell wall biosynthesis